MTKKNWKIYYPLLLGIYFAVELVRVNIDQMYFSAGLRSLLLTILFLLVVYALFCWRIKDADKAALLCAWFLLFFFVYGHFYDVVEGVKAFGLLVGRHRFLFPLWLVLFGLGAWWLYRRKWNLKPFSKALNLITLVLLVMPVIRIGLFEWQRAHSVSASADAVLPAAQEGSPSSNQLPDIYYIILDGYPRADMLLQEHDFDNSDFVHQLEGLGFYVAPCSQSNYAMTTLSLSSSLNMDYLEGLNADIAAIDLPGSIIQSRVRQFLDGMGYEIVSIESGIWFTEMRDADTFISQQQPIVSSFFDFTRLSEFEIMFMRTTVLRVVEEMSSAWLDTLFQNPRREIYDRILFEYDQLEDASSLPAPKFVFAHIMAPHSSGLIFAEDGSFEVSTTVDPALGNELIYLNSRTLDAVRAILAGSKNPPVIIVQSDHGLDTESRLANLSAIYFPHGGDASLYPTITPVNYFRLVFNTYFRQDLPLLPDVSFYSPESVAPSSSEAAAPDIYYIILDSYSRSDMLLQYYDLDNSGFVEQLEDTGFYVVPCSQSNYGVTDLSLATSLNMDYIQNVIPVDIEHQQSWISLGEPIRHSLVRQMLTDRGYQTIAFETGVWWTELQDADVYFRKSDQGVGFSSGFWQPTEFEVLFIRTTLLRVVDEIGSAWFGSFLQAPERAHAQFILYTLDQLETIPSIPGAKFVFVHLMAPHAPFVFSPEGEFVFSETADPGFPDETTYLNARLVPLVQAIIAESEVPPIIILQSDHGLDTEVRLANFIAVHFPGAGESVLYPTLTPVNIFRLVFNEYFGQDFPLLPDASYQSTYDDYYDFTEVTYPCLP